MTKLLIAECLSAELASMASERGHHEASHVAWIGKAGWKRSGRTENTFCFALAGTPSIFFDVAGLAAGVAGFRNRGQQDYSMRKLLPLLASATHGSICNV